MTYFIVNLLNIDKFIRDIIIKDKNRYYWQNYDRYYVRISMYFLIIFARYVNESDVNQLICLCNKYENIAINRQFFTVDISYTYVANFSDKLHMIFFYSKISFFFVYLWIISVM